MLLQRYMKKYEKISYIEVPDEEGGTDGAWQTDYTFNGALILDSPSNTVIGDAVRNYNTYTLTVQRDITLHLHDVIRAEDGTAYRTLSDGYRETPAGAGINMRQYKMERWDTV